MPWPRSRRRIVEEEILPAELPPPPPSNPWPWLLLLIVLVVAGLGGLWLWLDHRNNEATKTVIQVTQAPATTAATTATVAQTVTTTAKPKAPARVAVPDVAGQQQVDAGATVEAAGLRADTYPVAGTQARGTVVSQDPAAGQQVDVPSTVRLNVSLGAGARSAKKVPDVTGPTEAEARARARAASFTVRTVDRHAPSQAQVGKSLTQKPTAGASAPELTQMTIYVGR